MVAVGTLWWLFPPLGLLGWHSHITSFYECQSLSAVILFLGFTLLWL